MNFHTSDLLGSTATQGVFGFGAARHTTSIDFVGMRIARIELRNFGTYDGPATSFDFDAMGAVIAGGNGMGKSTAFDAAKVAFVTNPDLNNAVGAKGERSVASYYRGVHGDKETEEGLSEQDCLRALGDPDTTMGILVEFRNAIGRVFTAVRLLYIDRNGTRSWRYITGHREISLDADFPRVDSEKIMRDRGLREGFGLHGTFNEFMTSVAEGLGMEDAKQAKRAFKLQSIATGLPQMESTTRFARDYILPAENFLVEVAKAVEAIDKHREVRDEITEAEKKLEALTSITEGLDKLEKHFADRATLRRADNQIDVLREYSHVMQARLRLRHHLSALGKTAVALEDVQRRIRQQEQRQDELMQKIEAADGNKIDIIERELGAARANFDRHVTARTAILSAIAEARLHRTFQPTAREWAEIPTAISRRSTEISKQETSITAERDEAVRDEVRASDAVDRLADEIRKTEDKRSALPSELLEARAEIAAELQVDIETIPFLGELLQVKDEHVSDWELAANRLLGALATQILVPDALYARAKGYLPRLTKEANVRMEKVEDIDLCDDAQSTVSERLANLHPDALARKIDVKDDHALAPYAASILANKADLVCVSDEAFGTTGHKRAITRRGATSTSSRRAAIDNRRTSMVLGWSVDRQLKRLGQDMEAAQAALAKVKNVRTQCDAGIQAQRDARKALDYLEAILKDWNEIDTTDLEARIDRLEADLAEIQTAEMAQMRAERNDIKIQLAEDRKSERALDGKRIESETSLAGEKDRVSEGFRRMKSLNRGDKALLTRADYAALRARLVTLVAGGTAPSSESSSNLYHRLFPIGGPDIAQTFDKMRRAAGRDDENLRKRISELGAKIETQQITAFFRKFGDERDLPTAIRGDDRLGADARYEWRRRRDTVDQQELPKAQAAAAAFRKTSLHQQVLTLSNKLANYDKSARSVADGINQIMGGNIFNPAAGTFARLRITRSSNAFIREFEAMLSDAIDGYTEKTDEEIFDKVTAISDYLRDNETPQQNKRRAEIAHLANRFDAEVLEYRLEDNGTRRTTRRITGAGVLSGGEKDRLSTFLLASAMKCAFNAHDEGARDDALHTILIDEAFNRSTDENAAAQIAVLESFGLQVIAATPKSKMRPFQPVIGSVFMVGRPTNLQTAIARFDVDTIDFAQQEGEDEVPEFDLSDEAP